MKKVMNKFFKDLTNFITTTYGDARIPDRDKKTLIFIVVVLVVRILFIPDWIPYVGILDILFLLALVVDYIFNVLDQNLILSHYPWTMKSFARFRRLASFLSLFAPAFVKDNIWQYTKDPF
jgi:uncharacterized membrane protein